MVNLDNFLKEKCTIGKKGSHNQAMDAEVLELLKGNQPHTYFGTN
jgi:hypothetical protein